LIVIKAVLFLIFYYYPNIFFDFFEKINKKL